MTRTFMKSPDARKRAIALSVALSVVLPFPVQAVEIWKIDVGRSHFGPNSNTLILERKIENDHDDQSAAASAAESKIAVISSGSIYVASRDNFANSATGGTLKPVDYSKWKTMNLVKVGDKVRLIDYCNFACQSGLTPRRMTLTFNSVGVDAGNEMKNVAILRK